MWSSKSCFVLLSWLFSSNSVATLAFTPNSPVTPRIGRTNVPLSSLFSSPNPDDDGLGQRFGGYTAKQRLREEVESPFRKVRFLAFVSTAGSALTALYFSGLSTFKALVGGYVDALPLEQALQSDAINLAGVVAFALLARREYNVGEANLRRIAKGGQLARLVVATTGGAPRPLGEYRRAARVLIAAGGTEYIAQLSRSVNADQRSDINTIAAQLEASQVILVPVLLKKSGNNGVVVVGDNTRQFWSTVEPAEGDRNYDAARADVVVAFPRGHAAWTAYLESEIETASAQGFDVLTKGLTITVKKNGRILRRATGQPPWNDFLGAMEVMDGSRFGMPGDSERYGGP